jgi:hypothetical protein
VAGEDHRLDAVGGGGAGALGPSPACWWGVAAVNSVGKTWDAQAAAGDANPFVLS